MITDDELNVVGEIDNSQLYTARLRIDDYLIVTRDNKSFILSADNEKVAEIDIELKPVLIGDKLYSVHENSFFEIDADNLIERLQSRRQGVIAFIANYHKNAANSQKSIIRCLQAVLNEAHADVKTTQKYAQVVDETNKKQRTLTN